jgi:hypothetical protein
MDPYSCREVDECLRQNLTSSSAAVGGGGTVKSLCDVNANCINTVGSYMCVCKEGYQGDGQICTPVCSEPCRNGGHCVDVGVCRCRHGYMGKRCETDIDECTERLSSCDPLSTDCVNLPGGYYCRCRTGYRLDDTSAPTGNYPPLVSHDRSNATAAVAVRCMDVDECQGWGGGHTCPVGTTCRNTVGGYECVCNTESNRNSCNATMSCRSNGNVYGHGDTWRPLNEPCTVCLCKAGQISCVPQVCDCRRRSSWPPDVAATGCCAHCNRAICRHQHRPGKSTTLGRCGSIGVSSASVWLVARWTVGRCTVLSLPVSGRYSTTATAARGVKVVLTMIVM